MSSAFVTEHFFSPGNIGDIDSPDATGRAGSIICGATLRITLSIDESRRITEAKFRSAGCSYLVAACSSLTEMVQGKATGLAAALVQSPEKLIENLGEWPADRGGCAALACEALVSAIQNYSDSVRDEWSGEEALICTCFGVSEHTIERAIQTGGLQTSAEVTRATNAGAGCRSCWLLIQDMLDVYWRENNMQSSANNS